MRRLFGAAAIFVLTPFAAAWPSEPYLFQQSGGRVAWYHGERHALIAFDAVSDNRTKNTELYVVQPDGSKRSCVTCNAPIPKGFVGQPSWHPDGEHIVIQVENQNSKHRFYNHMSWGFDNDLWLIRRDGSGARKIWQTSAGFTALHPHFNSTGTQLMFAERAPTGQKIRFARWLTPGGENLWNGWRIHLARVNLAAAHGDVLLDHKTFQPSGEGFYETHGFTDDGKLLYSHTPRGLAYVDDIYLASPDGTNPRNLTSSPWSWEEHGIYSSRGDFAFMSSRFDTSVRFPKARPQNLRTELYVQQPGRPPMRLTFMNDLKRQKTVVSDYDWDRDGRRIVFQVANLSGRSNPELWIIEAP